MGEIRKKMFSKILVCCLVQLIFVLSVEGVSIILNPENIVVGSTDNPVTKFEVQCSSTENDIKRIYLLKILRRQNGYPFIGFALITDVDQAAKDASMPLDIQAKSNVTGRLDLTSGTLTLTINTQGMSCSDDAEFQCLLNYMDTSNNPRLLHDEKNLTVNSAPSNVVIVNPEYYVNGVSRPLVNNSVLSTGTRIKFGCSANIGTNRDGEIIWEKTQTLGSSMTFIRYTPSVPTDIVDDPSQPDGCSYKRMSTMYYNITSMDQDGVSFRCRVQTYLNSQPYQAVSNQEYRISAVSSSGTTKQVTAEEAPAQAGVIAGAVIGSIAGVVLIIVLIYFLCYRKRSSGESYRTKEEGERPEPPPTDYTYSMPDKKKMDGYDNKGLEEPHEKTTRYPRSGRGGFDGREGRNDRGHHNPGMDDEDGGTMHMSSGPIGTGV